MAVGDQKPIVSGLESRPDGSEVIRDVELAGKSAIVSGGYSGIGLETVRALASKGVELLVPARDQEKARAKLSELEGKITIGSMDLGDLASVRSFAEAASQQLARLDLLINNAGIMACPETRVGPGWEA